MFAWFHAWRRRKVEDRLLRLEVNLKAARAEAEFRHINGMHPDVGLALEIAGLRDDILQADTLLASIPQPKKETAK